MARLKALVGVVFSAMMLAACNHTSGPGEGLGTVGGAVAGGAVGGAVSGGEPGAVVVGAVAGGVIGNVIGAELDRSAQRRARDAELRALEHGRTGTPVTWRNGRVRGEVVPGPRYQVNAYDCRDFTHTVYGSGQPQSVRGTACRQPNGTWQSVS
ncbi:hypothetical protein [Bauldia sp.]|uniref:hypothetical protein n=1 Tax=Bauldia sp. TaxID=2575872 RepID=UPI003BAA75C9